jgi:hypothetical protein
MRKIKNFHNPKRTRTKAPSLGEGGPPPHLVPSLLLNTIKQNLCPGENCIPQFLGEV